MLYRLLFIFSFSICPVLGYNLDSALDNVHFPLSALLGFVAGKKCPPRDDFLAKLFFAGCAGYEALCSLDKALFLRYKKKVENAVITSSCKCVFWTSVFIGGVYDARSNFLQFLKKHKKKAKKYREQRAIDLFIGPIR